ncbi:MAG: DUF308 domain-containing protein [Clostridia bacterium]|nr:DUF308 domain-containing protein [Clostridia bacterium]
MDSENEQIITEEESAASDAAVDWSIELEDEKPESYGDAIIEGFSAHTNVHRMAKLTGLSQGVVTYIFAVIYFIVGVLCVTITDTITHTLPYIVGSMMIVIGIGQFIIALIRREYRQTKTNQTATSLIITALGVMIIIEHINPQSDWPITFISIIWGVLGLFEAAHAFNHALSRIANSERCVYYLIKGLIECIVAFMLLYQPDNHDIHRFHIIVFGANLIFDSITMLPPLKAFFTMK